MPVDEIEVAGTSLSLRCLTFRWDTPKDLFARMNTEGEQFAIDPENPGFHDCDANDRVIRGFFSMVTPFEVEHLVDGFVTKTLFKRVESCEFFATPEMLFVTGKTAPQKILERALAGLSGNGVSPMEFEFLQLSQFQDRLSVVKSIVLTNPKTSDVRRARLAGKIESYTEYNVVDPRNHDIESVAGLLDSPLGPLTITASRKGGVRLGVRRGFILTMDCLHWIISMIREEKPPERLLVS
jgi:hypothetical protein